MHNISSELKVVPGNRRIRVAIEWFVSYLWLLCCSPSIFLSLLYLKKCYVKEEEKIKICYLRGIYYILFTVIYVLFYIIYRIQ